MPITQKAGSVPAKPRWTSRWPDLACIGLPAALCAARAIYQLALPHVLFGVHGYDEGVYFAAPLRLVHGALPYADFTFVQPPGLTLLLSPVALLGDLIGTRDAFAIARGLASLVVVLNVVLAGIVARRRGRIAALFAATALAAFPLSATVTASVLLEPFLVAACLAGVWAAFSPDGDLSPNRLVLAGICFGLASAIKIWAAFPFLALLLCTPLGGAGAVRSIRRLIVGAALGFAVPCLPFFAAGPSSFVHDVLGAQLARGDAPLWALSIPQRLVYLTGLAGIPSINASGLAATIVAAGLALMIALVYQRAKSMSALEVFLCFAIAVITLVELRAHQFYPYYAYFPAAFMAVLAGCAVGRLAEAPWPVIRRAIAARGHDLSVIGSGVALGLAVVGIAAVTSADLSYARQYSQGAYDPGSAVASVVPAGACVVFDEAVVAITANRFTSSRPNCPPIVDTYGQWLVDQPAHLPPYAGPYTPRLVRTWRRWLQQADYFIEVAPRSDFAPWPKGQLAWLSSHYSRVLSRPGIVVERRIDPSAGAAG